MPTSERKVAHYYGPPALTREDLDALIDLLQDFVEDEPGEPEVQAWVPILVKLRAQRAVAHTAREHEALRESLVGMV